jgi:hypothetical protein
LNAGAVVAFEARRLDPSANGINRR